MEEVPNYSPGREFLKTTTKRHAKEPLVGTSQNLYAFIHLTAIRRRESNLRGYFVNWLTDLNSVLQFSNYHHNYGYHSVWTTDHLFNSTDRGENPIAKQPIVTHHDEGQL